MRIFVIFQRSTQLHLRFRAPAHRMSFVQLLESDVFTGYQTCDSEASLVMHVTSILRILLETQSQIITSTTAQSECAHLVS